MIVLALVPIMFLVVFVATFVMVWRRRRTVQVVAPVTARVRSSSPYRTPAGRGPARGF